MEYQNCIPPWNQVIKLNDCCLVVSRCVRWMSLKAPNKSSHTLLTIALVRGGRRQHSKPTKAVDFNVSLIQIVARFVGSFVRLQFTCNKHHNHHHSHTPAHLLYTELFLLTSTNKLNNLINWANSLCLNCPRVQTYNGPPNYLFSDISCFLFRTIRSEPL